jgi:predicted glutamine amidotransferase
MIAHVRYATTGCVSLENVHPFARELWGINFVFAHNGQVPKFDDSTPLEQQPLLGKTTIDDLHYNPVGDTDSEAVFCAILNALKREFDDLPTLPVLHGFLSRLCKEIIAGDEETTIFNFLLGCGKYTQFAFSWPGKRPGSKVWNGLYYIVRQPPFKSASLVDVDYSIDFEKFTKSNDRVAVITTKPLTDEEGWTEFERGQLIMFDKGLPHNTPRCCEHVELEGRGLSSTCFQRRRGNSMSSESMASVPLTSEGSKFFQLRRGNSMSEAVSSLPPTSEGLLSTIAPRSPTSTVNVPGIRIGSPIGRVML